MSASAKLEVETTKMDPEVYHDVCQPKYISLKLTVHNEQNLTYKLIDFNNQSLVVERAAVVAAEQDTRTSEAVAAVVVAVVELEQKY